MDEISVVIIAHNRRTYLKEAIESVLQQSLPPSEIIVVKNFEDTEIDTLVNEIGGKNILEYSDNAGAKYARGIEESKGDILCLLEDDDVWKPDKIEKVSEIFKKNEVIYYHNNYEIIDAKSETTSSEYRKQQRALIGGHESVVLDTGTAGNIFLAKQLGSGFNCSCTSFRSSIVKPHLELLWNMQNAADYYFFMAGALSDGKMYLDGAVLTSYRIHSQNDSFRKLLDKSQEWHLNRSWDSRIKILNLVHQSDREELNALAEFEVLNLLLPKAFVFGSSPSYIFKKLILSYVKYLKFIRWNLKIHATNLLFSVLFLVNKKVCLLFYLKYTE